MPPPQNPLRPPRTWWHWPTPAAVRTLLAAAQGERDAVELEADLRRELSDGELAKAKELARRYAPPPS